MADISKITLPSGNTYDIKDETAREMIANLNQFTYNVVNALPTASADTMYQIYLIQSQTTGVDDEYEEYITLDKGAGASPRYKWEMLGTISAPDLSDYVRKDEVGDLAYKDTASGSGTVTVPKTYDSTFTGDEVNVSVSGTASGSVSAPTISIETAGATTTVDEVASVGSMPTYTVANEVLTITAGSVPTTNSVTVKTGDAAYEASQPTFTGGQVTSTGKVTPTGSVATVTDTTESKTVSVTVS